MKVLVARLNRLERAAPDGGPYPLPWTPTFEAIFDEPFAFSVGSRRFTRRPDESIEQLRVRAERHGTAAPLYAFDSL
jgi:hypothetical protein